MLIRNRLTLTFTLLATGIQLVLSVLAWYFYSFYRQEEFYERLQDTALVAGRLLIARRHLHDDFFKNMVRSDLLTIVDEQISIWDHKGQPVFTNRNLTHPEFFSSKISLISANAPYHFKSGRLEGIGIQFQDKGQSFYIFCAGYDSLGISQADSLQYILTLINLVGFSLTVLAGWYFSNKALAPITTIIEEVGTINYQHLSKRVNEGNKKDEIAQLAMTFNQMLLRLEEAFIAQRSFVSHASHELRTPLTNVLGTLETSILYDKDNEDLRQSMQLARQELVKLINLTNSLLSLAKATDGNVVMAEIQVDDCLLTAISQIQAKYKDRKIHIQFPEAYDEEFFIQGSAPLLTTAFSNILDNACKYSSDDVFVNLLFNSETIELRVVDKGKGISQEDVTRVFEPLFRGKNAEGLPGFGIGLSVTQKVVELHGGTLQIESLKERGTTIILSFPILNPDERLV